MDRPITTLFMLLSVDGKISTGATDELDVDRDFPGIDGLKDEEKLHELLTFANAAASLVTTKKGALCVMPTVDEVEAYIKASGR